MNNKTIDQFKDQYSSRTVARALEMIGSNGLASILIMGSEWGPTYIFLDSAVEAGVITTQEKERICDLDASNDPESGPLAVAIFLEKEKKYLTNHGILIS